MSINDLGMFPASMQLKNVWVKIRLDARMLELEQILNTPEISKKFLRLNNRKKRFTCSDFKKAKYFSVLDPGHSDKEWTQIQEWCNQNIGPNWCCCGGYYWFQTESDAVLFKMRWF